MEDVISLTPKQIQGLVYHLNEELYLQYVHGDNQDRIISEKLLNGCVNFYNSPNIPNDFEEQENVMSLPWQLEAQREAMYEKHLEKMLALYNDVGRAELEAQILTDKEIEEME